MKKIAAIILIINFSGCIFVDKKEAIETVWTIMPEKTKKKIIDANKSYVIDPTWGEMLAASKNKFEFFEVRFDDKRVRYLGIKDWLIIKVENDFFIVKKLPINGEINYTSLVIKNLYNEKELVIKQIDNNNVLTITE